MNWKMSIFNKIDVCIHKIQPKFNNYYFAGVGKLILNFTWKCKGTLVGKAILKIKVRIGGHTLDFETNDKVTVIKTV